MSSLPDYAVSPGEHIQEWLDDHALNAAELARRLDVTPKHVSELLSGKAPLSASVSLRLERVTGIPARIWNRFEAGYREDLARLAEREALVRQYPVAKGFPLTYLRKWGFIQAPATDQAETVRELLTILRIGALEAFDATWVHSKVAYRKAPVVGEQVHELATWFALGERQAALDDLPVFETKKLKGLLPQLRALTMFPEPAESVRRAAELLRGVGVAICFIPPIPGFGVYGATRWIEGHPLIQLSLRGKKDDQFWFTLFHELGHVLLHGHKTVWVQGVLSPEEKEADDFAAELLVPQEFQLKLPKTRNLAAIQQLADELTVAPSIVLGQAQRITGDYAWGKSLQKTIDWDSVNAVSA